MLTGISVQAWRDLDDDRAIVTALEMLEQAQRKQEGDSPQMSG